MCPSLQKVNSCKSNQAPYNEITGVLYFFCTEGKITYQRSKASEMTSQSAKFLDSLISLQRILLFQMAKEYFILSLCMVRSDIGG